MPDEHRRAWLFLGKARLSISRHHPKLARRHEFAASPVSQARAPSTRHESASGANRICSMKNVAARHRSRPTAVL
jgi:hypothetical protein